MRWWLLGGMCWIGPLLFGQGNLHIQIFNISPEQGSLRLALYESPSAYDGEQEQVTFGKKVFTDHRDSLTFFWENIPPGRYALAIFQDLNDNDLLDNNALGIPQEPYAFSNNPKAKWRKPRFAEIAFSVEANITYLHLDLKTWKDY